MFLFFYKLQLFALFAKYFNFRKKYLSLFQLKEHYHCSETFHRLLFYLKKWYLINFWKYFLTENQIKLICFTLKITKNMICRLYLYIWIGEIIFTSTLIQRTIGWTKIYQIIIKYLFLHLNILYRIALWKIFQSNKSVGGCYRNEIPLWELQLQIGIFLYI